jgi:hypothetical protein
VDVMNRHENRNILLATVGAASILAMGAWSIQLMWNFAVVAAISVAEPINFWHGLCLLILLTVRFNVNGSD